MIQTDPSLLLQSFAVKGNIEQPQAGQSLEEAAGAFEAMLIKEMFGCMRETQLASPFGGGQRDQSMGYYWSMFDEQIAEAMAKEDVLNLRSMVMGEGNLEQKI